MSCRGGGGSNSLCMGGEVILYSGMRNVDGFL